MHPRSQYNTTWARQKRSTPEGRDAYNAYMKEYRAKKKYGLTLDEHDSILEKGCQVCGTKTGKLCIDHCHTSGKVRGCLCSRCNLVLGQMEDNPEYLIKMAEYIQGNV